MTEQPGNNSRITFYKTQERSSSTVLPLIIVDILVSCWAAELPPVTVTDIKAELLSRGYLVDPRTIRTVIVNIDTAISHPAWQLCRQEVRRGRTKCAAFYIQFKTPNTP